MRSAAIAIPLQGKGPDEINLDVSGHEKDVVWDEVHGHLNQQDVRTRVAARSHKHCVR
jgi:hypothetical protein